MEQLEEAGQEDMVHQIFVPAMQDLYLKIADMTLMDTFLPYFYAFNTLTRVPKVSPRSASA